MTQFQRKYDPSVRNLVLKEMDAGKTMTEISEALDLPKGTVSAWMSKHRPAGVLKEPRAKRERVAKPAPLTIDEKATLGDLLIGIVRETMKTLSIQQEIFRDPYWLHKQSAESLAILHGTLSDKAVRILGALAAGEQEDAAAAAAPRLPEHASDRCDNDV